MANPAGNDTTFESSINANSLYNLYSNYQPPQNKEWIELFNPSNTDTVDISCYTLGSNAYDYSSGSENWGALTFPEGTIILPRQYLIVGGNDSDVPFLDFDLNYYYENYFQSQYLDGDSYRWFLRNQWGWIALYNEVGEPVDAVYWVDSLSSSDDLYTMSQFNTVLSTSTACSGYMNFTSAAEISNIEFAGFIPSENISFQRDFDESSHWNISENPSPGSCNGGECLDFLYQTVCSDDTTFFTLIINDFIVLDSIKWFFDDTISGSNNISYDENPYHIFSDAGNYNVTVIAYYNNNYDSLTKNVTVLTRPFIDLGADIEICNDDSVVLNAGAIYMSYFWNTGSTASSISADTSGIYWLRVSNGTCYAYDSITVSYFPFPPNFNLGNDTAICHTQDITFDAGSGFLSYLWQDGSTTQTFYASTMNWYWVEIENIDACKYIDSIFLATTVYPVINLPEDTLICDVDSFLIDAENHWSSYAWSTGESTQIISVTETNMYYITVTNNCGIQNDSSFIKISRKADIDLSNDSLICSGDTIVLQIDSLLSNILWSTGDTSYFIQIYNEGEYIVSVENECGVKIDTCNVIFQANPFIELGVDTIICDSSFYFLPISNSNDIVNWIWSTGDTLPNISVLESNTYYVTVSNICEHSIDSVKIEFDITPFFEILDTTICIGDSIYIEIDSLYNTVIWSTGDTTNNFLITNSGEYIAEVQNLCGSWKDTSIVTSFEYPNIYLGKDTTLEEGNVLLLDAEFPEVQYLWNTDDTISTIEVNESGTYWVQISNFCGLATDTITINFTNCSIKIEVPNVFTPNGDGINDAILLYNNCEVELTMNVYTRWGALVYQNTAEVICWEGRTFAGKELNTGVYFYTLEYNFEDNTEKLSGFIHIVK